VVPLAASGGMFAYRQRDALTAILVIRYTGRTRPLAGSFMDLPIPTVAGPTAAGAIVPEDRGFFQNLAALLDRPRTLKKALAAN